MRLGLPSIIWWKQAEARLGEGKSGTGALSGRGNVVKRYLRCLPERWKCC